MNAVEVVVKGSKQDEDVAIHQETEVLSVEHLSKRVTKGSTSMRKFKRVTMQFYAQVIPFSFHGPIYTSS